MNLDELRTVQSKERSKDSLQHLRESFYADVADYVADLRERRDRAAERADNPFDDPEVNRLTDEIHTAEEVVEAIYERRVGKVVKRASLAAAGMPADEEGLTSEEQELFGELVETIETNKEAVLDVLAGTEAGLDMSGGTSPATSETTAAPDPGDAPTTGGAGGDSPTDEGTADVSAADVMGGESAGGSAAAAGTDPTAPSSESDAEESRPAGAEAAAVADASADSASAPDSDADSDAATDADSDDPMAGLDERTTVRLTDDVGEIFGVDERTYELASEDVVTLPEANAEPLLERGAAERLE
jgi:DNA replication factor GINS